MLDADALFIDEAEDVVVESEREKDEDGKVSLE